jgi:hypothetical protein
MARLRFLASIACRSYGDRTVPTTIADRAAPAVEGYELRTPLKCMRARRHRFQTRPLLSRVSPTCSNLPATPQLNSPSQLTATTPQVIVRLDGMIVKYDREMS